MVVVCLYNQQQTKHHHISKAVFLLFVERLASLIFIDMRLTADILLVGATISSSTVHHPVSMRFAESR
jgi:hypothetical protein